MSYSNLWSYALRPPFKFNNIFENRKRKNLYQSPKTPFSTSFKGSFTIEATFALPLFLSFMMFLIFFMRIMEVEAGVQQALGESARTAAVLCTDADEESGKKALAAAMVYSQVQIKERQIPLKFVSGGILGFDYSQSKADGDYITLKVNYSLKFPIDILTDLKMPVSQATVARKWRGYNPHEAEDGDGYVYVARTGEVYHLTLNCTYIDLSTRPVTFVDISSLRNASGGKYKPCRTCCKNGAVAAVVYVTDYGEAYHISCDCSQLKRTISRMKLQEALAKGLRRCSKCGEEK